MVSHVRYVAMKHIPRESPMLCSARENGSGKIILEVCRKAHVDHKSTVWISAHRVASTAKPKNAEKIRIFSTVHAQDQEHDHVDCLWSSTTVTAHSIRIVARVNRMHHLLRPYYHL